MTVAEMIEKFLTIYGPLGLGWVVAALQWRENLQMNAKFISMLEANMASKYAVRDVLNAILRLLQAEGISDTAPGPKVPS